MTPPDASFEMLQGRGPRRKMGCKICGAPTVAVVSVAVRRLDESHQQNRQMLESRQRSFCEKHAVETYLAARELVPE